VYARGMSELNPRQRDMNGSMRGLRGRPNDFEDETRPWALGLGRAGDSRIKSLNLRKGTRG